MRSECTTAKIELHASPVEDRYFPNATKMCAAIFAYSNASEDAVANLFAQFESRVVHQDAVILHANYARCRDAVIVERPWTSDVKQRLRGYRDYARWITGFYVYKTRPPDASRIETGDVNTYYVIRDDEWRRQHRMTLRPFPLSVRAKDDAEFFPFHLFISHFEQSTSRYLRRL